ncbi:MAG TPA: class I SAM-dependent methyltransferase [Dissulfurispiraceae bacterium]|nr:class I SAM-dependent methyltransferase [Dissulfurispiraceae bacterium]
MKGIYCFMDVVSKEAELYAADHSSPMSDVLEEVEHYSITNTSYPSMLTGRVEGRFLSLIAQLTGATRIVDVGTFTGYSALAMAEAMPDSGNVITIENNPKHAALAREFFDRSPHGRKITSRLGEALDVLADIGDEWADLVFIDADKQNYMAYYEESMRVLRRGGYILADNVLWYGRIFEPEDEESKAVADFNELVLADKRTDKLFLTIRDGIYLIKKK